MSDEPLMRMKEINELIQDGLMPYQRMRILLEELLELRINYDLKHQPLLICEECSVLKNACFFEKKYSDKFYKVCRYCRLVELENRIVKLENRRKNYTKYYCPSCDCDLLITDTHQTKFVVRKHSKTKKHQKNLKL